MSIFSKAGTQGVQRSAFDLSHERKMSIKQGFLYPMLLEEILPSDKFEVSSEVMLRMAPMIAPVMHRVNVKVDYFFVPNRLVWNEWEDFITGGEQGDLTPVYPTLTIDDLSKTRFVKGSLSDYFGIPVTDDVTIPSAGVTEISALPFRAYTMIYNEYYRDQNLETEIPIDLSSGSDSQPSEITTIRKRAWEKDYFTSALPWSQRGGEAQIPLGSVDPVYKDTSEVWTSSTNISPNQLSESGIVSSTSDVLTPGASGYLSNGIDLTAQDQGIRIENLEKMDVDATTINDLRKANRLQEWLEKSARGGARYIEQIWAHFKQRSSDARLQRPEHLGSSSQPIVISEVLNTTGIITGSEPDATGGAQGDMAGHGISVGQSPRFTRKFEEHGYVIGLLSVLPKTTYQQGVARTWTRRDKFDYAWPSFAHLGEQEVLQQEIYQDFLDNTLAQGVFGYQQRFAEYKYQQSTVHGDFRDDLQYWHLGRFFDTPPALSKEFVISDPSRRIFAVTDPDVDSMYVQIYNRVKALRPLPYNSIPTL